MASAKRSLRAHSGQIGSNNPAWKGGRSVASNGYVLIRVGTEHHLADVRGYAYEHRIVAEEKIGRRLEAGEIVHHTNGNKQDNRAENLEVVRGNAEHFLKHRQRDSDRRLPGEENPTLPCACGCGIRLTKFDGSGRPRLYITGHNPPASPTQDTILDALRTGCSRISDIAIRSGITPENVRGTLSKLKRAGKAVNIRHGEWRAV